MVVTLRDVPLGRHFAVPLGKSANSAVLWWMCSVGLDLSNTRLCGQTASKCSGFLLPPSF